LGNHHVVAVVSSLKNRISVDLGVNVPMVKFLQGFSVAQAATQLLDQLTADEDSPANVRPVANTRDNDAINEDLLANIDKLSEEQVNSKLAEMLTKDAVT